MHWYNNSTIGWHGIQHYWHFVNYQIQHFIDDHCSSFDYLSFIFYQIII